MQGARIHSRRAKNKGGSFMKTRIVYPQLWLDEKFAECSLPTKLLFNYLINNIQLGLSPYLHITDRQILFDTGLTVNQLETGKQELTKIKWCFFTDNWVFHNHKCAYIDYTGRDRVIESKEKEISSISLKIREYFKGLISGYEGVINPPKTINHKSKTINQGGAGGEKGKEYLFESSEKFMDYIFKVGAGEKVLPPERKL